jgi:hypothetical protein
LLQPAQADVAVAVHARNTLAEPAPRGVQDIFLGRARTFPGGRFAVARRPVLSAARGVQPTPRRPPGRTDRRLLGAAVVHRPSFAAAVLKTLRENESGIGHADPSRLDKTVRLLLLKL